MHPTNKVTEAQIGAASADVGNGGVFMKVLMNTEEDGATLTFLEVETGNLGMGAIYRVNIGSVTFIAQLIEILILTKQKLEKAGVSCEGSFDLG